MLSFLSFLLVAMLPLTHAHFYVNKIVAGGKEIAVYDPFRDCSSSAPKRPTRKYVNQYPVMNVMSENMACNGMASGQPAKPAPTHFTVAAGTSLDFHWKTYYFGHRGPMMTYMAKCDGPCEKFSTKGKKIWFKIDEQGYIGNGKEVVKAGYRSKTPQWASDKVVKQGFWRSTIPKDLKPGNYIIRHEGLALHNAARKNGAQFFISCHQVAVTGKGTRSPPSNYMVQIPGAYKATDPGILINIYKKMTSYKIPGPRIWRG